MRPENKSNEVSAAKRAHKAAARSETKLFVFSLVTVTGLAIWAIASGTLARGPEVTKVFNAMVLTQGCVIAEMGHREPSAYRCNYSVDGHYAKAHIMWEEAGKVVDARYEKK